MVLRTVHIDGLSVRINYIHIGSPSVSLCGTEARDINVKMNFNQREIMADWSLIVLESS